MSERIYTILNFAGPVDISFDELDDTYNCLCTFPTNDEALNNISKERLRSLALLGAAVCIAAEAEEDMTEAKLPHVVPQWIRDEIDRLLCDIKDKA